MIRLIRRVDRSELLDRPEDHDDVLLRQSLDDVADATIRLGGVGPLATALATLPTSGPLRVLDVGSGNGRVAQAVGQRLARRGLRTLWTASDLSSRILREADPREVSRVACDARGLPFVDEAFDASLCVLTLHHFAPDGAAAVLAEMRRVSRFAVVVSDLRRSRRGLWGARLLAETVWRRNRLTRHDAPTSVRRAYTSRELSSLAVRAGLDPVAVTHQFPFRLLLIGRCRNS